METILSIIAIVISAVSGFFTIYAFIRNVNRDRKQATLDAYNTLQNEALDRLNFYLPSEIREIAKDPRSAKYKEISIYIARIEHFCVGVNEKIYDRKVVYRLAHGYLDAGFIKDRINPIIERKQKNASEEYYNNIREVVNWMEKYKKK